MAATSMKGLLQKLIDSNGLLDKIMKGLNAYLEKKRLFFSRFVLHEAAARSGTKRVCIPPVLSFLNGVTGKGWTRYAAGRLQAPGRPAFNYCAADARFLCTVFFAGYLFERFHFSYCTESKGFLTAE